MWLSCRRSCDELNTLAEPVCFPFKYNELPISYYSVGKQTPTSSKRLLHILSPFPRISRLALGLPPPHNPPAAAADPQAAATGLSMAVCAACNSSAVAKMAGSILLPLNNHIGGFLLSRVRMTALIAWVPYLPFARLVSWLASMIPLRTRISVLLWPSGSLRFL